MPARLLRVTGRLGGVVPSMASGPDPIRAPGAGASTAFRLATARTLTRTGPSDRRRQP